MNPEASDSDPRPLTPSQALHLLAPPPRIVVIDDDTLTRQMIVRTLGEAGMVCRAAAHGAEGLALIRAEVPDLVLLDIVRVGGDGYAICRELRRTFSQEQLPVVMSAGLEDLAAIQAAYQAGANDFLTKPLHWKHLPFQLRHVMAAARAFQAARDGSRTLRTLFSVHPDSLFTITGDGAVTLIHSGLEHPGSGFRPALGRLEDLLAEPLAAQVRELCRAALAAPARVFSLESAHPLGGELRYWEGRFIASAKDQVLVMVRDMTERKRTEEALRESNQRLELATRSASLGIWDRDLPDGKVIWNERMFELYGLDPALGVPPFEPWLERVVHPEDRVQVRETMGSLIEDGAPRHSAYRIALPDGTIRNITSSALVIRDGAGRAVRVLGVNRDRTEQVRAEFERRRLQEERQHSEKLESLGSLAGGMAHDMNNVLAAIMGLASALRSACGDEDPRARALDGILHASGRGRDLVKALTEFAHKGLEEPGWFDLNELLHKEAELLGHARSRRVDLLFDLDPALPMIFGDASALGSAIINLGVNALDAMPDGGTLGMRTRVRPGAGVELVVSDTGQGMTPEVLARAMEPFYTTKPLGQGTGLGLARVYGTVKAHQGTLELRSEPGRGTSVLILLPIGGTGPAAPDAPVPAGPRARPLKVLLVDDDDLIRDSTHALLDALDHDTVVVDSGEAALARLESGYQPEVVLLDMHMPGLGGAGTLPRLRLLRPELPVLLTTGRADPAVLELVRSQRMVSLLTKPFGIRELRQHLERLSRDGATR